MVSLLFAAVAMASGSSTGAKAVRGQDALQAVPANVVRGLHVTEQKTLDWTDGLEDTVVFRQQISIWNTTDREISSVSVRLHNGSYAGQWSGDLVKLQDFHQLDIPFRGSILPGSEAQAVISVQMPKKLFTPESTHGLVIYGAEEVAEPSLNNLGHLYTFLHNNDAETTIPALQKDPSLLQLRNASGLNTTLAAFAAADRETLEWILANGGDGKSKSRDGYTALHIAVANFRADVLDLAEQQSGGADPKSSIGTTPLMRAIFVGNREAWKWLLERKADAAHMDTLGNTVAKYAIIRGRTEALEDLVKSGVRPNELDKKGQGWMHYTLANPRMIDAVMSHKVPVDQMTDAGMTTLMLTICEHLYPTLVSALLVRGADPSFVGPHGKSAYDFAASSEFKKKAFEQMVKDYPKGGLDMDAKRLKAAKEAHEAHEKSAKRNGGG